jgi:NAD(P)-dependent dehydrogenase (short-subunit alcohol dehydrogenase family)
MEPSLPRSRPACSFPGVVDRSAANFPVVSTTKTALVTGATRGIGKQVALGLARRGYDVAFTGRTHHEGDAARRPEADALPELKLVSGSLDSTTAAIEALGRRAIPLTVDLLDRNQVLACGTDAIEALGHIDVLCNNAIYVGPAGERRFLDTPADEIEKRLYGNIAAQLLLMQSIVRHIVERGGGVVGNVTSGAGYAKPSAAVGEGGWALTYGVSKAGFHRIISQLLIEHERDGLRAYNLQPGAVATERVMAAGDKLDFVRRHAAPVEVVGDTIAHILAAAPGEFANGANLQVQDIAREMGTLPA